MVNPKPGEKHEFDMGKDALSTGFRDYNGPHCEIDGVEAFYPYVTQYNLKARYNNLIVADVRYLDWNKLPRGNYEVAFCGDVLEHLSPDEAHELLNELRLRCDNIIVSIPIVKFPQGSFGGNDFETHQKDDWTHEQVLELLGRADIQHDDPGIEFFEGNAIGVYWIKNGTG